MDETVFDVAAARARCLGFRRRILDISQQVGALHIAPAFSCLEIVDCIYHGLMRRGPSGASVDTFVMSKGHGCMAQYVILEELKVLSREDLALYCKPGGKLGAHPDYGTPGIEASTGSLGHGFPMALGMAYAAKVNGSGGRVFTVLSDGELQEGSTWEATMLAPALGLSNLVAFVDFNDFQSLGRTSDTHPSLYPIHPKFQAFGWDSVEVSGHDAQAIHAAVSARSGDRPMMVICKTTKGRGVRYMENVPIWHYRAPNPEEYREALSKLEEIRS